MAAANRNLCMVWNPLCVQVRRGCESVTLAPMTSIESWRARGKMLETRDGRVFAVDTGGAGTPVLVLHGFPTSSFDFAAALEHLRGRRVVLFDFLGFGLSDKPAGYGYSLFEQADVALAVADRK